MMRLALPLLLALTACDTKPDTEPPVDYPDLVAGRPKVGAAEGVLWLPMGTPLAGFSARCGCLGGFSRQDQRESAYALSFVESTGVHVRPRIKAVWIENGDEHLVMTKADVIYAFDGLTTEVTRRLEELTGEDLKGKLTFGANHNHSSYGGYSDHVGLYLGSDRFSPEIFDRMAAQLTAVAFEAYQNRRDAAIGIGWEKDWDPESRVYSDRREQNNDLVVWPDMGPEQGGKDPYLNVIRMDDATTGDAIAVIMAWGMHPYAFGEQNSLATADATAFVEDEVSESFDHPVVSMFLQTGGGDASIRGKEDDSDYVQMESLGLLARDKVLALYDQTPTSSDAITLETFSRRIPMSLDLVKVSRDGTVNWYYPPYEENRVSDDVIYNEDGTIKTPLDEFNTEYGVAFCGSGDFDLPVGGMLTESDEYTSCMNVTLLSRLLLAFFRLTEEEISLPLHGMESVYTTATRIGPVPVRYADGTTGEDDALFGFFPGESVSMFTEQWRRRTLDELGYRNSILFGYSQDHEGYLLIAEDWLRGGYEPDINFWGPLGSEYIMEQVMDGVDTILSTPDKEPPDQSWDSHEYPVRTWETKPPDLTPEAGTRLAAADVPAYFWIAEGFELDLAIPAQLPRVAGQIQIAWKGGDPAVDETSVTLERQDAGGAWQVVTSPTGRRIDDDQVDFVVAWTPDPLFPAEALQTHYYWAAWQAVNHMGDRAALPLGRYRLHVEGHRATSTSYPYETAPYELFSDEFEVVPAAVTITPEGAGAWLSLRGHPNAFRLVDLDGQSRGDNPLRGALTVQWYLASGDQTTTVPEATPSGGRTWLEFPAGEEVNGFIVTDTFGNWGSWGAVPM